MFYSKVFISLFSSRASSPVVLSPGDNNLGDVDGVGDGGDHPDTAPNDLYNNEEVDYSNFKLPVTGNRSKALINLSILTHWVIFGDEVGTKQLRGPDVSIAT